MKKLKLSPWHDGSVKPVHVGVYQRIDNNWYSYWNGTKWLNGDESKIFAAKECGVSYFQNEKWRGVLK